MKQLDQEIIIENGSEKAEGFYEVNKRVLDYDDQPYGEDNILVRSSKRRSLLASFSKL